MPQHAPRSSEPASSDSRSPRRPPRPPPAPAVGSWPSGPSATPRRPVRVRQVGHTESLQRLLRRRRRVQKGSILNEPSGASHVRIGENRGATDVVLEVLSVLPHGGFHSLRHHAVPGPATAKEEHGRAIHHPCLDDRWSPGGPSTGLPTPVKERHEGIRDADRRTDPAAVTGLLAAKTVVPWGRLRVLREEIDEVDPGSTRWPRRSNTYPHRASTRCRRRTKGAPRGLAPSRPAVPDSLSNGVFCGAQTTLFLAHRAAASDVRHHPPVHRGGAGTSRGCLTLFRPSYPTPPHHRETPST